MFLQTCVIRARPAETDRGDAEDKAGVIQAVEKAIRVEGRLEHKDKQDMIREDAGVIAS